MINYKPLFDVRRRGETLIISACGDLSEFEFDRLEEDTSRLVKLIESSHARNVVMDLARSDYYGSTALTCFTRLHRQAQANGGRLVLCGVSPHELEILRATRLQSLWPIYASVDEALAAAESLPAEAACSQAH